MELCDREGGHEEEGRTYKSPLLHLLESRGYKYREGIRHGEGDEARDGKTLKGFQSREIDKR